MISQVQSNRSTLSPSGQATLARGSRGAEVRALQAALGAAGFDPGPIDGDFGPRTAAALRAFQASRGLEVDGVAGPRTFAALAGGPPVERVPAAPQSQTPMLGRGDQGPHVERLQRRLASRGFDPGGIDGDFGPRTQAAVKAFQRAAGIEVDGVVGPQTWAALENGQFEPPAPSPAPAEGGGAALQLGASGAKVEKLQQLLADAGFDPGPVDGQFGPRTRSAVMAYQRSRGLGVDGVAGPKTFEALLTGAPEVAGPPPVSGDLRARIVALAQREVGTPEATGNNDGAVLKYPEYFGRGREPYCADFVSYIYTEAGNPLNYAYCPYLEKHLKDTGKWKGKSNPQPGDIVMFDWEGDGEADHVGLVKSVNPDGSVVTIEGNTEDPWSGRQGVYERVRYLNTIRGFANP